jgi:6-bladed beta-propeller
MNRWTACRLLCGAAALLVGSTALPAQPVVRLPAADQPIRREARVVFEVGAADGAGADVFGAVGDVGFDGAENLYVLDRLNARVVVFDSTGRFVRSIGRRGGGPGEFGAPQQMAVSRAGEVIVSDAARRGLAVFDRDGSFARTVPFAGPTLLIGGTLALHPRGGVVSRAMGNPAAAGANAFGEEVLLWVPTGTGAVRTLLSLSTPGSRATGSGAVTVHAPPIFSPRFHFGVLPDGAVAVADGATWSVRILDTSARVIRVLERPLRPRRVTARDRELEIARRLREESDGGGLRLVGAAGGPMPSQVRRTMAEALRDAEFAAVIPVIAGMQVDSRGNLWIARAGPALDRPGSIDIVSAQGRYLGTVAGMALPAVFSPGGRAAFIRTDALGVQRVVVVRL